MPGNYCKNGPIDVKSSIKDAKYAKLPKVCPACLAHCEVVTSAAG
jgi:hypothetical protein